MFDHKHYVPILTAKRGEYLALRTLDDETARSLTPMLQIPPIAWDFENDEPAETIDQHLADVAETIKANWERRTAFVELFYASQSGNLGDGSHPVSYVFSKARAEGIRIIPVTGIGRDSAYQEAVKQTTEIDGQGLCLRLNMKEIGEASDLESQIGATLRYFNLGPPVVDLVIDVGPMEATYTTTYNFFALTTLATLPHADGWRSLTLAGAAFPQDLSSMGPDLVHRVFRGDWNMWKHVVSSQRRLPRLPTFGDYGISGPEFTQLDFRYIKMSASIRYTDRDHWIVVKGHSIRKGSESQYPALARTLVSLPEYCGPDFSWGDRYIEECAAERGGRGSATTWRQVGTNHHLTFVSGQIANFHAT